MTTLHHLNFGWLHAPPNPKISCHCLLLEDPAGLALVDTGIGLLDVARPLERIGQPLIDLAGFKFNEADTAVHQLRQRGFQPEDVRHILLTHCDPDHAGGVADFPAAQVHVSAEEHAALTKGLPRYLPVQFEHGPRWAVHGASVNDRDWFGFRARPVDLGFAADVLLVPLFGHTLGHCGVAVRPDRAGGRWTLHAGDAYYLRPELSTDDHPVSAVSARQAVDNDQRIASLARLRKLFGEHGGEVDLSGYHDVDELLQRQGRTEAA